MNNTEILEALIKSRRSIRKFKPAFIPDEDVIRVIDAARFAPSNTNYQPWRFIYIKDENIKKELKDIVVKKIEQIKKDIIYNEWKTEFEQYSKYFTFFADAPGIIIVLCKKTPSIFQNIVKDENIKKEIANIPTDLSSVSAAIQNMLLMFHSMGYGACWTTGPLIASKEIKDFLKIEPFFELGAIIPFGIPDEKPNIPKRKQVDKIFIKR